MLKVDKVIFFFIILGFLFSCDTAEDVNPRLGSFVKLYGSDGNQFGVDIKQLAGKDMILLARVEKPQTRSFMLIRVDTAGNEVWQKEIHDDNEASYEIPKAMMIDEAENIIVVGDYVEGSRSDVFIYKISALGEVQAKAIYDINVENRIDVTEDVATYNADSYMISGHTKVTESSSEEFFMLRIDHQLNRHADWVNEIIPYSTSAGQDAFRRTGNRITYFGGDLLLTLITSNRIDASTAGTNIEISYVNSYGLPDYPENQQRQYSGTDFNDEINGLTKTADGFAYIGTINNPALSSVILGEISSGGTKRNEIIISNAKINRNLKAKDVGQLQVGRLVILAEERVTSDNTNLYMAEVDNFGTIYWEHAYGGDDIDNAAALLIDGKAIYAVGSLKLSSQNKILLIKTDGRGKL
jgi:hypothetical protein